MVKAAVNDWVVHSGAHGQPEERQVDLLDKLLVVDVLLEGPQDEVEVVGQPADGERQHHQYHGFHKLVRERRESVLGTLSPKP